MDAPATVVWIAPAAQDADQTRALTSWARAHGVTLEVPQDASTTALPIDPEIAEQVEGLVGRARDALAARDAEATDRELAAAHALLETHPELPQAAWLAAEIERTTSARLSRIAPIDMAGAAAAWTRAAALDGGRVAGAGETPGPPPPAATVTLDPEATGGTELVLDGERTAGSTVTTRAGRHALVVAWNHAPVWAGWIDVPAGTSVVHTGAPSAPACSVSDVARVRVNASDVAAPGVQCPSWIAVTPADAGVRVALCTAGACGPFATWRAPVPWTYDPPVVQGRGGWPAWGTWTLVGAGALVAGTVAVLASGVLSSAPSQTQFVTGGVRTH